MSITATVLTAADVERGRPESAAERRDRLNLLPLAEWRERIDAAVSWSLRRTGGWTDGEREEIAAELWLDGWQRLLAESETIGQTIYRAVMRHYGVRVENGALPRRDDAAHSERAYYGRAGNARAKVLAERAKVTPSAAITAAPPSTDDSELTAADVLADDAPPPDDRARGTIGAAELSGQRAADARVIAHRLCKRLRLPVFEIAYVAARCHTDRLQVTAELLAELHLTPRQWESVKAEQVALIAAECDDPADLIRHLTGCEPRAGHISAERWSYADRRWYVERTPEWRPATLNLRPRAKARRVPVPVLIWAPADDGRAARRLDEASARHGRSMAEAGERARNAPREAALKLARDEARARAAEREPSSERIRAAHRPWRAARAADIAAWRETFTAERPARVERGPCRAVGSAAAAARYDAERVAPDAAAAERLAERIARRREWRAHPTDRAARAERLAELLQANTARRRTERLDSIEPGLALRGRVRDQTAAERDLMPAWETDNGRTY